MDIEIIFKKHNTSDFPYFSIKINNYKNPIKWFQIVNVKSKYSLKNDKIFKNIQNRFLDNNTFIDANINENINEFPFYNYGNKFEDYPEYSKKTNIKWIANIYAVEDSKTMKYICGYKWGFEIIDGNIFFIIPSKLNETKIFMKYKKIIKSFIYKY